MINQLLSPEVQKFIKDHQADDPFLLSLNSKEKEGFPLKEAIEQIQSFQKAKAKLPFWTSVENIIWPPPVSIEQSSSETTAKFKSSIIQGNSIVDLTGGMGVDSSYFAESFDKVIYVESNEGLCERAVHNFETLGKRNIQVVNLRAEDYLDGKSKSVDVIFIDPSRRSENKKVFKIEDCSPNLYDILPKCKAISHQILIKLSPLVDLSHLIREFNTSSIWVVAVKNEVKEVLCLIESNSPDNHMTKVEAIDLSDKDDPSVFKFLFHKEAEAKSAFSLPLKYLYEPNTAIMKAGAFKLIGNHYGLKKLHQHTHLYTSDELVEHFPGKILTVIDQLKLNKKAIQMAFPDKKVNVITRNFPLTPTQLKTKYSLKDGGEKFIIGTTLFDGEKVILVCEKLV